MARSKDSSQSETSGWLFSSDEVDSDANQQTSDDLGLSSRKAPKDRSDSKSAKNEKSSEQASLFPCLDPQNIDSASFDEKGLPFLHGVSEDQTETKLDLEKSAFSASGALSSSASIEVAALQTGDDVQSRACENLQSSADGHSGETTTDSSALKTSVFSSTLPPLSRDASYDGTYESPNQTSLSRRETAYQVVARRYRPQAFDELIGQETVARALSNAIETNRVGHAYLFTGARGVGKTSCARIFAKALNCVEGPTTRPCLKCDSCVSISTGDDVDVIEIDGASNRGVDEIRQLRQNAAVAPSRSRYKIYIIDEVHMLTREAFNALLKTLEEPPVRVKFIFCTTEPNKIPITILSRCQRFDFSNINGASISSRLKQIATQEGTDAEDGVFDVLARRANGSMRDAQSLLEQLLSFAPNHISLADVHSMLGSVDDGKVFELIEATAQGDSKRVFELLGSMVAVGVDFGTLIEQTFGAYRDLMVVASGCNSTELIYSPVARFDEIKQVAKKMGLRRILASLQILDQTTQRMRYSAQARILAELAFARLCQLDAFQPIETLVSQLKSGAIPQINIDLDFQKKPQENNLQFAEDDKKKIATD